MSHFGPIQDADDASPILTSCDIVKVPDPQMGMVRGQEPTNTLHCLGSIFFFFLFIVHSN